MTDIGGDEDDDIILDIITQNLTVMPPDIITQNLTVMPRILLTQNLTVTLSTSLSKSLAAASHDNESC